MLPETRTYNLSPKWTQRLERFSLPAEVVKRLQEVRPHPLLPQIDWLLLRIADGDAQPGKHPNVADYCPDYPLAVKETWRKGDDRWMVDGKLKLTRAGKSRVERLRILYAQGFPRLVKEAFKVRAAPLGSSNQLVRDEAVWDSLTHIHRDVAALEMEASAIGAVAERNSIQCWTVMKGVMDFAHRDKDDRFKQFAACASAEALIDFLRKNLVSEELPLVPAPDKTTPEASPITAAIAPAVTASASPYGAPALSVEEALPAPLASFGWLHFTDLYEGQDVRHGRWPAVREVLFQDLRELHATCGPRPDLASREPRPLVGTAALVAVLAAVARWGRFTSGWGLERTVRRATAIARRRELTTHRSILVCMRIAGGAVIMTSTHDPV